MNKAELVKKLEYIERTQKGISFEDLVLSILNDRARRR